LKVLLAGRAEGKPKPTYKVVTEVVDVPHTIEQEWLVQIETPAHKRMMIKGLEEVSTT
jgi:hypothetical protein